MILDIIKTNAAMLCYKEILFAPEVLIYKYERNVQENFYCLLRTQIAHLSNELNKIIPFRLGAPANPCYV